MRTLTITKEELDGVIVEYRCSGMFLSGGQPMGNPAARVADLCRKYGVPTGYGLDPKTGTFVNREGKVFEVEEEDTHAND